MRRAITGHEKHPDVEILHAVLAIDVVQGRALAQGDADEPFPERAVSRVSLHERLKVIQREIGKLPEVVVVETVE